MPPSLCPTCQQPIPPDAPAGLCPRCLLAAAATSPSPAAMNQVTADYRSSQSAAKLLATEGIPTIDRLNRQFATLKIEKLIGQGGMGAVYLATQKQLDRRVALKIIVPELGHNPAFVERFSREAKTMARLSHPNIVNIFDFGVTDELCYFVMEYVDGINLRDAIGQQAIAPTQALEIIQQICDALQYAHDQGIVHRDIKPENILIDRQGNVKIADFGLAKIVHADRDNFSLTATHQILGTRNYMAPEQIEKPDRVDHRADIYSLGVVFYELLTGELPIGRFASPSEKANVMAALDEVVLKTLEKEPSRRFQQASELRTAVSSLPAEPANIPQSLPPISSSHAPSPLPHTPPTYQQAQFANHRKVESVDSDLICPFRISGLHGGLAYATGILRYDHGVLQMEFEIVDEVLNAIKSKPVRIDLPVNGIYEIDLASHWFGAKIKIQARSIQLVEKIPASKSGKVDLAIAKSDRTKAEYLIARIHRDQQSGYYPSSPSVVTGEPANPHPTPATSRLVPPQPVPPIKSSLRRQAADPLANLPTVGPTDQALQKITTLSGFITFLGILNIVFSAGAGINFFKNLPKGRSEFKNFIKQLNPSTSEEVSWSNFNSVDSIVDFIGFCFSPMASLWPIGLGVLMLMAATYMKEFQRYKFCWMVGLLMLLPYYHLYPLGFFLGIWCLVTLINPEVRRKFVAGEGQTRPDQNHHRQSENPPFDGKVENWQSESSRGLSLLIGFLLSFLLLAAMVVAGLIFYFTTMSPIYESSSKIEIIPKKQVDVPVEETTNIEETDRSR